MFVLTPCVQSKLCTTSHWVFWAWIFDLPGDDEGFFLYFYIWFQSAPLLFSFLGGSCSGSCHITVFKFHLWCEIGLRPLEHSDNSFQFIRRTFLIRAVHSRKVPHCWGVSEISLKEGGHCKLPLLCQCWSCFCSQKYFKFLKDICSLRSPYAWCHYYIIFYIMSPIIFWINKTTWSL